MSSWLSVLGTPPRVSPFLGLPLSSRRPYPLFPLPCPLPPNPVPLVLETPPHISPSSASHRTVRPRCCFRPLSMLGGWCPRCSYPGPRPAMVSFPTTTASACRRRSCPRSCPLVAPIWVAPLSRLLRDATTCFQCLCYPLGFPCPLRCSAMQVHACPGPMSLAYLVCLYPPGRQQPTGADPKDCFKPMAPVAPTATLALPSPFPYPLPLVTCCPAFPLCLRSCSPTAPCLAAPPSGAGVSTLGALLTPSGPLSLPSSYAPRPSIPRVPHPCPLYLPISLPLYLSAPTPSLSPRPPHVRRVVFTPPARKVTLNNKKKPSIKKPATFMRHSSFPSPALSIFP